MMFSYIHYLLILLSEDSVDLAISTDPFLYKLKKLNLIRRLRSGEESFQKRIYDDSRSDSRRDEYCLTYHVGQIRLPVVVRKDLGLSEENEFFVEYANSLVDEVVFGLSREIRKRIYRLEDSLK